MSTEIVQIIDAISHEKGIDRQILIDAIEAALLAAARRRYNPELELEVAFNEALGEAELFLIKEVAAPVINPETQISLKEAKKFDPDTKKGMKVKVPGQTDSLGRIAALNAKQIILQRVREAETDIIYNNFKDKTNEVVSGVVVRQERRDVIVDFGRIEGILPRREQVSSEKFRRNDRIRAYVLDIRKGGKGVYALLSRSHPRLLSRLFEMEVPEIAEGIIEIKNVVREPGGRAKIAVFSNERDVDPVGACVGMRGVRVQSIVNELRGEKIDIVHWSEDPATFVSNALSPAKISRANLNEKERSMEVIVPDDQLSLAIGKRGQNVRLASNLIKWRIDIKGEKELRRELEEKESREESDREELAASIQAMEGMEVADVDMLLGKGIDSFREVLKKGLAGLLEAEVDEEKARALIDICQAKYAEEMEREKELGKQKPEKPEKKEIKAQDKAASQVAPQPTPQPEEQGPDIIENIEEFPIDSLKNVPMSVLKRLKASGYQTVAEVSAAEIYELIEEGLEKDEAEEVYQIAVQFLELHEKV